MKPVLFLLSVSFLVLSYCNSTDEAEDQPAELNNIPELRVEISSEGYLAPDSIEAGYVRVSLENSTEESHSAHLIRVKDGHSVEELLSIYADSIRTGGERPDWMLHCGGVIATKGQSEVILDLEAGRYAWVCVMGPDSLPHFTGHENQELVVTESKKPKLTLEAPDVVIRMTDQGHQLSKTPQVGKQVIDVLNVGDAYHLVAISRLSDGSTESDVVSWFKSFDGPPPAEGVIATSAIGPDLQARLEVDFEKGEYVLFCMANAEGYFHLFDGAISSFTVE
jgi:hypothetical protein